MYEVLSRRFRRAREGGDGDAWKLPDLIVVDGGKGQLGMALAAARDVGIDVRPGVGLPIVGLAKEREDGADGTDGTDGTVDTDGTIETGETAETDQADPAALAADAEPAAPAEPAPPAEPAAPAVPVDPKTPRKRARP